MATTRSRKVFINLPVRDLKKTMAFFSALGFEYNPKFTDDNAACMILSEEGYVMLLTEPFFKNFTTRPISDASKQTEAIIALSCDSREEVDEFVGTAMSAGARDAMPPQDYGFMYSRSFYDLDGHHWEVLWMNPKAAELGPKEYAASVN